MANYFVNKLTEITSAQNLDKKVIGPLFEMLNSLDLTNVNFQQSFVSFVDEELRVVLNSSERLPFRLLIWKNTLNLYIGKEHLHPWDDVFLNTEDDYAQYRKNIRLWLCKSIEETLLYDRKSNKLRYYSYEVVENGRHILYSNCQKSTLSNSEFVQKKYSYASWCVKWECEVYVRLLNEGVKSYRPVPATKIKDDVYKLEGHDTYSTLDEIWEFPPGTRVVVAEQKIDGVSKLVAVTRDFSQSD